MSEAGGAGSQFSAGTGLPVFRVTRVVIRNTTTDLLCVVVEPLGNDYWVAPDEALTVQAETTRAEVECVWWTQGVSLTLDDADALGVEVLTQDGSPVVCGYQRPPHAFDG